MEDKSSKNYKTAIKGTAIFGGVQVFNILINLVRGKFVALFLGPEGMGISSLYNTAMSTIQQFSSLGLNLAGVKEISSAKELGDGDKIAFTVFTYRRILKISALLGALVSIAFCSTISELTFGNSEYQWGIAFLSLLVFFTTLSNGELSILQGVREIKRLAYSSLLGSGIGLFVGVPLYYFYGFDGIVPAMIILSLSSYSFYFYTSRKALGQLEQAKYTWSACLPLMKKMIALGLVLMVASLLGTLTNFLLNTFIRTHGTIDEVGLYQAANSITSQYVGLIFTAMSLDYFPRLSAVATDNGKVRELVNQQTEIIVLGITPILILLIIATPILIRLLLTSDFLPIIDLIRWMSLGLFFKAVAFPMGYISFSKGDKKTFFWLEGVYGNLFNLLVSCILFYTLGLNGLGVSLFVVYLFSVVTYLFITKRLYEFSYSKIQFSLIVISALLLLLGFSCSFIENVYLAYLSMCMCLFFSSWYSVRELDKRISMISFIKQKIYGK